MDNFLAFRHPLTNPIFDFVSPQGYAQMYNLINPISDYLNERKLAFGVVLVSEKFITKQIGGMFATALGFDLVADFPVYDEVKPQDYVYLKKDFDKYFSSFDNVLVIGHAPWVDSFPQQYFNVELVGQSVADYANHPVVNFPDFKMGEGILLSKDAQNPFYIFINKMEGLTPAQFDKGVDFSKKNYVNKVKSDDNLEEVVKPVLPSNSAVEKDGVQSSLSF